MTTMQLELPFMMQDPYQRAITIMEERYRKNTRAAFAQIGSMKKELMDVKHEFSTWKQAICNGTVGV